MNLVTTAAALSLLAAPAFASVAVPTTTEVVFKLNDSASYTGTKADALTSWTGTGGINEGVAGATELTENGIDYKSSFIDTNWSDVISVLVGIYNGGLLQAYVEFDAAGTTKENFFTLGNVLSSSWTDITTSGHNFFSIAGSTGNDRHWYINTHWGGCGSDTGHMVVLDGPSATACNWEDIKVPGGDDTRAFLYAIGSEDQNYNGTGIGQGDVFAVSVTYAISTVPVPASGLLLLGALGAAGLKRRRRG